MANAREPAGAGVSAFAFRPAAGARDSAAEFAALAEAWTEETALSSSVTEIASNRHYRRIVGMGEAALPLILDRLRRKRDDPEHWFEALAEITGEDPVPDSASGNTVRMADAWLRWADGRDAR